MKKTLFLMLFVCLSCFSFASVNKSLRYNDVGNSSKLFKNQLYQAEKIKECTVKLDFELEDGTVIQGTLTFSDVSWWDCSKMQLVAWWERNF